MIIIMLSCSFDFFLSDARKPLCQRYLSQLPYLRSTGMGKEWISGNRKEIRTFASRFTVHSGPCSSGSHKEWFMPVTSQKEEGPKNFHQISCKNYPPSSSRVLNTMLLQHFDRKSSGANANNDQTYCTLGNCTQ